MTEDFGDIHQNEIISSSLNRNLPWYSCPREEWTFTRRKHLRLAAKRRRGLEAKAATTAKASSWASIARGQQQAKAAATTTNGTHTTNDKTTTTTTTAQSSSSSSNDASVSVAAAAAGKSEETSTSSPATARAPRERKPLGEVALEYEEEEGMGGGGVKPRGLINTGNLCFMNSILQVLIHCEPFYRLVQQVSERVKFNLRNTQSPILDGLIDFVNEFRMNDHDEPFAPESFYKMITMQKRFDHLQRGRQEDAQEFLGYLLEGIHEEFVHALKEYNHHPLSTVDPQEDQWIEVGSKKKAHNSPTDVDTPISKLFGGEFQSILNTPKSAKPSITNDPFQHVQLDISDDKIASIEDAFALMSHTETIPYKVNNGEVVNATKQVLFKSLPKVLIVHLKRFIYQGNESKKMSKPIKFSSSLEIPRECLASLSSNNRYQLFAVVYHHGSSSTAGHYTVDVKTYDNSWINIDDILLQKIEHDKLGNDSANDNKSAYLLFYVKLD
jgi:ubiquitin carboxyl-terminal hydrolase 10